jgi:hypothetical protein
MEIIALGLLAAGFAFGLGLRLRPAAAQPEPQQGQGLPEEVVRRYGARHALAMVGPASGSASTVVNVASHGWRPSDVLVVELAAPAPAGGTACDNAVPPSRIAHVTCQRGLAAHGLAQLTLHSARATSALVYSVDPAKVADACASFEDVRTGRKSLEQWELDTWSGAPGEPLAVSAFASTAAAATGFTGRVSLPLPSGARPNQPNINLSIAQALPVVWPEDQGGRAVVMNASPQCQTARLRVGSSSADECPQARVAEAVVPPFSAIDLAAQRGGRPGDSLYLAPNGGLSAAADRLDDGGWYSYGAANVADSAQIAFPLAVAALPGLKSELWVTNQQVTATAKIAIVMFDGNGALHKLYNDPKELCPGSSRPYDIAALAGEIPPTIGRGERGQGPPMLSLRVESENKTLAAAPPISGLMVLKSDLGVTAYSGLPPANEVRVLQAGRRDRGLQMQAVVPGVKMNYGTPPMSTLLAIQGIMDPSPNTVYLDIYDPQGHLVRGEVPVFIGQGLVGAGYFDFARPRIPAGDSPFPQNFIGTVVVRGQQGFGIVGVVAVDRPVAVNMTQPSPVDRLSSVTSSLLPLWPDPSAPTPTPRPTQPPATRTPGEPTPGRPTPTAVAPTPTTAAPAPQRLLLPALFKSWPEPEL